MSILIVEDDSMLRNWLSMLLHSLPDWQLSIYEACDGLEALSVCETTEMELVITDIKMPRMDGLQLIAHLQKSSPATRTAVLSSYDDFAFVKKALQYGALDYILKAELTITDLFQLLSKVQNDIHVERILSNGIFPNYSSILNAQKVIVDFIASQDKTGEELLQALRLPEDAQSLAILYLHLQEESDVDIPVFEAADICEKALFSVGLSGIAIPYQNENVILFYAPSDSVAELQEMEVVKLISLIENHFQKYLSLPIDFNLSRFCRRGGDVHAAFREICNDAACRLYYGSNVKCTDVCEKFPEWKAQIHRALEANRLRDADEALRQYLEEMHTSHLFPDIIHAHLLVLLNIFMSVHVASKASNVDTLHSLLVDVAQAKKAEQMRTCVNDFLKEFLFALNQVKMDFSPATRSAIDYVEKHYAEKIALDDVAESVFMNRSYFCQIFKREVGMTFGDYVERVRIDNAKRLLASTNIPISNVAEETGFNNQAYFTKIFKRATDISPLRYRKLHFYKAE